MIVFSFFFSPLFNLFALQKPGVNRMLHCTSLPSGKETAQQVLQPKPCAIQPNAACLRAAHKHTRSHPAARSHQVPTCFGNAHQQDLVLFVSLFLFFFFLSLGCVGSIRNRLHESCSQHRQLWIQAFHPCGYGAPGCAMGIATLGCSVQ